MRLLPPAVARRVVWKNGLGSTLEVATDAAVPGEDWTWRLSIADVPSRAPFSAYPGIDRCIACLEGPGLILERGGVRHSVPREGAAFAFPGEESVTGEPAGPGVRDVNLMVRRDRWRGRMTLVREVRLDLEAPLVVVHAVKGSAAIRLTTPAGELIIEPGRTAITGGHATLPDTPGGLAVACALHPAG